LCGIEQIIKGGVMLTTKQINDYADEMIISWDALKGTGDFSADEANEPIQHLDQASKQAVHRRVQEIMQQRIDWSL
jgi:hypothetical protein